MTKIIALAIAAALAVPFAASADPSDTAIGRIALGNPQSKAGRGITERTNPCGAPHPVFGNTNGVDGFWVALPEGSEGRRAVLATDAVDADVWFYRAAEGCELVAGPDAEGWRSMATPMTADEDGIVPTGATHALVDLVVGNDVTFTLTLH